MITPYQWYRLPTGQEVQAYSLAGATWVIDEDDFPEPPFDDPMGVIFFSAQSSLTGDWFQTPFIANPESGRIYRMPPTGPWWSAEDTGWTETDLVPIADPDAAKRAASYQAVIDQNRRRFFRRGGT